MRTYPIPEAELEQARRDFCQSVAWKLLKRFLEMDLNLDQLAHRIGMNRDKLERVFTDPGDITIKEIGMISCGLECDVEFKVIPRGTGLRQEPKPTVYPRLHRSRMATSAAVIAWRMDQAA